MIPLPMAIYAAGCVLAFAIVALIVVRALP